MKTHTLISMAPVPVLTLASVLLQVTPHSPAVDWNPLVIAFAAAIPGLAAAVIGVINARMHADTHKRLDELESRLPDKPRELPLP